MKATFASVAGLGLAGCLTAADPGADIEDGEETPGGGGNPGWTHARVESPPYEITEPDCGESGERDSLWLCTNMATEPSQAFEQVETTTSLFEDEGLDLAEVEENYPQFYAVLLAAEDDLERIDEDVGGDVATLIEETDFTSAALLVVQTGWGSGSETPHIKRIEATDTGIHAFGCYRRPCAGTADYTKRTVVARFERPSTLDDGVVSLTVDAEHQVNVRVGEGVVTVTDVL